MAHVGAYLCNVPHKLPPRSCFENVFKTHFALFESAQLIGDRRLSGYPAGNS
jgi:hypothetical protein